MQNVTKRVEVVGKATGLEKLKTELNGVAVAQDKVSASGRKMTVAEQRIEASNLRLVAANQKLSAAQKTVNDLMAAGPQPLQRMAQANARLASAEAQVVSASASVSSARKRAAIETASATAATNANTAATKANAMAQNAMASSSGAAAFRQRQLAVQSLDVAQSLALGMPPMMVAIQQGGQLAGIYAGQGGIKGAAKEAAASIMSFARANPVALAGVAALGAAVAGMRHEINQASGVTVSFGQVANASLKVIVRFINDSLRHAIAAIGGWFGQTWDSVVSGAKFVGNTIINFFRVAYNDVVSVWGQLPNTFSAVVVAAANAAVRGLNFIIEQGKRGINALINQMNRIPGVDIGMISTGRLELMENTFADTLSSAAANRDAAIAGIMASDPLGQFFTAVKTEAVSLAKVAGEDVPRAAGKAGNALKAATNTGKDAWKGLRTATTDTLDKMRDATSQLGSQVGGVFRGLIDGTTSWKDAAISAFQSVLQYANQMNVAGGGSGIFGGGFVQSLLGGVLGIGFSSGGYTGNGGRNQPAGVVHGQEYVVNAQNTARFRPQLEAMNRGQMPNMGGGTQGVHVTFGTSVDNNGNLMPFVENVSQRNATSAAGQVAQAVPMISDQRRQESQQRRIGPAKRRF